MSARRILLVEDEAQQAQTTRLRLEGLGYNVVATVVTGEEAVKQSESLRPDLVLMDIVLPGQLDGVDAARRIRERFDIPVVYVSAHADEELLARVAATEPFGFILKPYTLPELHATLSVAMYRAEAEKQLRQAAWSAMAFSGIPDAVIALDREGKVVLLNPAAQALLRVGVQDAVGKQWEEVIRTRGHTDPAVIAALIEQVKSDRVMIERDDGTELLIRGGGPIPVNLRVSPVTSPGGEVSGATLVFRDISERVRTRHRLRQVKDHLQALYDASPDMVFLHGGDGRLIDVNDNVLKAFGYSREEMLTLPFETFMGAGQSVGEAFARVERARAGEQLEFEWIARRRDGEEFPVEVRLCPLGGRQGEPAGAVVALVRDITERKRAEAALQESEQKYRTLFETMAQGVVYQDASGAIVSANPAAERILGLTLEQMQGRSSIDPGWRAVHEDGKDFPGDTHPAMVALQTGRPVHDVLMGVFNPAIEIYKWILVNAVPQFRPGEDKPCAVYATFTDISEAKQAQELIREREARLRVLTEQVPAVLWTIDTGLRFTSSTGAGLQALGLTPNQVVGQTLFEYLQTEDSEHAAVAAHRHALAGETVAFDLEFQDKAYQAHVEPLLDDAGQVMGAIGVALDITERRGMEDSLQQERDFSAAVLDTIGSVVTVLDCQGRIVQFNKACEALTGYTFEEVKGRSVWEVVLPESQIEAVRKVFDALTAGQFPNQYENHWVTKDGQLRLIAWSNTALVGKDGVVEHVIATGIDITERKAMEQALVQRESMLRAWMESARDFTVYRLALDPADPLRGRLEFVSPSLCDVMGVEPDAPFETWFAHVAAEDRERVIEANRRAADALETFDEEMRIFHSAKNEWRWIRAMSTPVVDEHGGPTYYNGLIVDITGRRRAEEQLRQSEQRYRMLFDANPHPMWVYDLETYAFLAVNDMAVGHYGYSEQEFLGMTIKDIRPPEDVPALEANVEQVTEGVDEAGVWCHVKKDGTVIDVEIISHTLSFAGRRAELVLAHDVTERKRADDALKKSQSMLRLVLDSIPERVFWKDSNSVYLGCNRHFAMDAGFNSPEEIIGKDDAGLSWQVQAEHYRADDKQVLESKTPKLNYEETQTRPDGTTRWVQTSKVPLTDFEGNIIGVLGCYEDITGRKLAQGALARSKAEFEAMFNAISDAVIYTDTARRILMINPAVCAMFGYGPEELKGKTTELIYAEKSDYETQGRRRFSARVRADQQVYEMTYRRKDGTVFIGETLGTQVKDPAGDVIGFMGVIRDVTERKRAEELRGRFGRILDKSFNEIYVFDADSLCFTQVNRGALENLGYSPEEITRLTPLDLKPDFTREAFLKLLQPLRDGTEEQVVFETRHRRRDGSYYPVEVNLQLTREETPPVFVAIIQDMSERLRAEEALRESEAQVRLLLESTGEAIYGVDAHGYCTFANPACLKLIGYNDMGEVLGKNIHALIHHTRADGTPYPKEQCRIVQTIARGEGIHVTDEVFWRKDGDSFPVEYWSYPIYRNRELVGSVVAFVDITERRRAEAELERYREHLEELVEERTNELTAVNRELETFAYSVSHDLRAPLRSINGFGQALAEDCADRLDAQGQNYLQRVIEASRRMGELIDDLLTLSRITRSEMHQEAVDLSALAGEVMAQLREQQPGRRVEAVITPGMGVRADRRLVRVVLENLLGNAWKFTGKCGEARIECGCESIDGEPVYFVRDNGAGFDMAYVDKLFGAFQRLHSVDEFEGTGIGLATVQRVIHRHGGRAWAEGAVGQGASIYFTLP